MRKVSVREIWILALLMAGFVAGCGREQAPSTAGAITAPRISSTNPANGSAVCQPTNRKITATFTKTMDPLTINTATFTVVGTSAVAGTVTLDAPNKIAIFTPNSPGLGTGIAYTATITTSAKDTAGNTLASNFVWTFTSCATADATAPTVIFTVPANLATGVPLNQKITATFSEGMDSTTLIPANFTVTGPGTTPVTGTVSYAGVIATFTPTSNLAASAIFTATITTGAKDLAVPAGVPLAANFVWTFTTGTLADSAAPTITSTVPANAATNVPLNQAVNATFSKDMDPSTISTATFTLVTGTAPVTGTVSYVASASSRIATFTPQSPLASNSTYTATILNGATGVKDLAGNALASGAVPNPWTFLTGTVAAGGQATINLGRAGTFAVMANDAISSTGSVVINGDVGLAPGTSQGIPTAQVNGQIHVNDTAVAQAKADLLAAYNDAVSRSTNAQTLEGNLGGLTKAPGLYVNSSSVLIQGSGPNNNLTLDAGGNANAVFIFKMGSTLTTATSSQVILAGGALAKNVFWQVGTSTTLGVSSIFKGNLLTQNDVTVNTSSVMEGRVFAGAAGGAGAATINASSITVP